jgi:preprotein translocase subunit SecE
MHWLQKWVKFLRDVRQEMRKVTWPTHRDVLLSSVLVGILAGASAGYFFFVDSFLIMILQLVLGGEYGG